MKRFTQRLPFWSLLLLTGALFFFYNCSDEQDNTPPAFLQVSLSNDTLTAVHSSQFLTIETDGSWQIHFIYPDTVEWCSASPMSGEGNKNVVLASDSNTTPYQRVALIKVTSGFQTEVLSLLQWGKDNQPSDTVTPPTPDPDPTPEPDPEPDPTPDPTPEPDGIPHRLELPKVRNPRWFLEYKYMAMEWDTVKKHSVWVAYVLHHDYLQKKVNRKDEWKFDNRIPEKFSPTKADFGGNGYSRGHLCPSGSRLFAREANSETFYYSNMSPQIQNGYNGGIWGTLEGKVRDWASQCDTLYIVTGGTILKESDIIKYTNPSRMAVPKYHFKALLRRKGNSFDAIGFILEHKVYSDKLSHNYSVSIDKLEEMTGIDFFHNLPDDIENNIEAKYEPNKWSL